MHERINLHLFLNNPHLHNLFLLQKMSLYKSNTGNEYVTDYGVSSLRSDRYIYSRITIFENALLTLMHMLGYRYCMKSNTQII